MPPGSDAVMSAATEHVEIPSSCRCRVRELASFPSVHNRHGQARSRYERIILLSTHVECSEGSQPESQELEARSTVADVSRSVCRTRGISFYELNNEGRTLLGYGFGSVARHPFISCVCCRVAGEIAYVRDIPESLAKPPPLQASLCPASVPVSEVSCRSARLLGHCSSYPTQAAGFPAEKHSCIWRGAGLNWCSCTKMISRSLSSAGSNVTLQLCGCWWCGRGP